MYKINQRPIQILFGIGFLLVSVLITFLDHSTQLDFLSGFGFAIGLGLLIAAAARLKVFPEKSQQ